MRDAAGHPAVLKRYRGGADPATAGRVAREAAALAGIDHPGVIRILAAGRDDAGLYLLQQFCPGETLAARLRRLGPRPLAEAERLLSQLLDALAAVHRRGVAHRDLKPANLMVRPDGRLVLIDFGLARRLDPRAGVTATGEFVGTPRYCAPGQVLTRDPDPRDDLYAAGVITYEALAGANPFAGHDVATTLNLQVSHVPPPLHTLRPDVPPGVARVVARLLEKRREDRYADADAAREALARAPREAGATAATGADEATVTVELPLGAVGRAAPEAETPGAAARGPAASGAAPTVAGRPADDPPRAAAGRRASEPSPGVASRPLRRPQKEASAAPAPARPGSDPGRSRSLPIAWPVVATLVPAAFGATLGWRAAVGSATPAADRAAGEATRAPDPGGSGAADPRPAADPTAPPRLASAPGPGTRPDHPLGAAFLARAEAVMAGPPGAAAEADLIAAWLRGDPRSAPLATRVRLRALDRARVDAGGSRVFFPDAYFEPLGWAWEPGGPVRDLAAAAGVRVPGRCDGWRGTFLRSLALAAPDAAARRERAQAITYLAARAMRADPARAGEVAALAARALRAPPARGAAGPVDFDPDRYFDGGPRGPAERAVLAAARGLTRPRSPPRTP